MDTSNTNPLMLELIRKLLNPSESNEPTAMSINTNPMWSQIYQELFNPKTPPFDELQPEAIDPRRLQQEMTKQEEAKNPEPGWLNYLWNAAKSGVPALNIADWISIQKRKPGEFPISFESNAPQQQPSGKLPDWLLPPQQEAVPPVPTPTPTPTVKKPVPTQAPLPDIIPEPEIGIWDDYGEIPEGQEKAPVVTEIPSETAPTETPTKPTEEVDFTKMVSPWQSRIDYEKEIEEIFRQAYPDYKDLPQSKYKHPETPMEYLTEFMRLTGWALNKKDPYAIVKSEEAEAEAKAKEEREYVIKKSTQLATMRLNVLSNKMKKEEEARADQAAWLEYIGNAQPELRKQPSYQAAVASIRGIPPEDAGRVLNDLVDKNTGLLEGMYVSEIDKAIQKQEALNNYQFKKLKEMGYSDQRASFAIATGSFDMEQFLMHQYQTAQTPQAKEEARKAILEMQSVKDISQIKALNFIRNRDTYRKLFADDASFKYYNDWATATALLGKDAPKPPVPKEVTIKEEIAREMWSALGNPKKELEFSTRHGVSAKEVFNLYMRPKDAKEADKPLVAPPGMPEPLATIFEMTGVKADKLMNITGDDPYGTSLKQAARDLYTRKYAEVIKRMNAKLPKDEPLTVEEIDRIATAARVSVDQVIAVEHSIYAARGKTPKSKE